MPHKYSYDALMLRRDRAIRLGYIIAKPHGTDMVCVPRSVSDRAKTMARSLFVHDRHDQVCGHHSHFARSAALLAKPLVSAAEFASASALHRKANAAKHSGLLRKAASPAQDPVWLNDPWKQAAAFVQLHPAELSLSLIPKKHAAFEQQVLNEHTLSKNKKQHAAGEPPAESSSSNPKKHAAVEQPAFEQQVIAVRTPPKNKKKQHVAAHPLAVSEFFLQPAAVEQPFESVFAPLVAAVASIQLELLDAKGVLAKLASAFEQLLRSQPALHPSIAEFHEKIITTDNAIKFEQLVAANAALFAKVERHGAVVAAAAAFREERCAISAAAQMRMMSLAALNASLFDKREFAACRHVPFVAMKHAAVEQPAFEQQVTAVHTPLKVKNTLSKNKKQHAAVEQPAESSSSNPCAHGRSKKKSKPAASVVAQLVSVGPEVARVAHHSPLALVEHMALITHNSFAALAVLVEDFIEPEPPAAAEPQLILETIIEDTHALELLEFQPCTRAAVELHAASEPLILANALVESDEEEDLCEICFDSRGSEYFFRFFDENFHCCRCHTHCSDDCMPCGGYVLPALPP
jgi:hypothetical protein